MRTLSAHSKGGVFNTFFSTQITAGHNTTGSFVTTIFFNTTTTFTTTYSTTTTFSTTGSTTKTTSLGYSYTTFYDTPIPSDTRQTFHVTSGTTFFGTASPTSFSTTGSRSTSNLTSALFQTSRNSTVFISFFTAAPTFQQTFRETSW